MLFGGTIAAFPWVLHWLLTAPPSHAQIGKCVTAINGQTTWCGYLEGLKLLAMIFGLGAVGGLVFWICVAWRGAGEGPK